MDHVAGVNAVLALFLSVAAFGAVVASWGKWFRPRLEERRRRQDAFEAAILGRPAIMHPDIPGKVLTPAVPGMGERQATVEGQLSVLVDAVAKIADTHQRVDALEHRVERLESGAHIERVVQGVESVQMLRTMEAAVMADPPSEPPTDSAAG